ncbi:MAG: alpha-beta hydrolase superfamily lysophospholipase [Bradymonadia bacterium]|jgi:alpha-beta hydrolase superfamily lysophospholipase
MQNFAFLSRCGENGSMKLKLRRRREAGDEGTTRGKAKVLLVVLLLLALAIVGVTWLHASSLVFYSAPDQTFQTRAQMEGVRKARVLLAGQPMPKPRIHVDPSKYEMPFQNVSVGGGSSRLLTAEEKRLAKRKATSQRRKDRKETRGKTYVLESWFIPNLQPAGLAVVFHDYGQSKADLLEVAAEFHDLHFSVLMVDLRASGETEGREVTFGFYEARDVAQAVLKANDFVPAGGIKIVYGIGTGAAAVLKAASEKKFQADALIVEGVFDELRHFVDRRIDLTGMSPALIGRLTMFWIGNSEDFVATAHNPVDYAKRVTLPTLVLHGAVDEQSTLSEATRVAKALKTSVVSIRGAGRPIANTHSDAWYDAVKTFVGTVPLPTLDAPLEDLPMEGDPLEGLIDAAPGSQAQR